MTGTITFGGIGSGIDTESIVSGIIQADSTRLNALQDRSKLVGSALTTLSSISQNLSSLRTAALALDTARDASAYKATSSSSAVVTSISGAAMPGSFEINVSSLATEQRTYSRVFDSNSTALGQTGTLDIGVGTATPLSVDVTATDTLASIASKINSLGLRVSASTFYDGSKYRLQVRGLDTGAANALTFTENGVSFDLNGDGTNPDGGKTAQQAADASLTVDNFAVTSATNQIVGAVPGLTLALTAKTTAPLTVTIASDSEAVKSSLKAVESAFNSVVSAIHLAAGFGDTKASNAVLAGDSALRSITSKLSDLLSASGTSGGSFSLLSQVGLSLSRDGTVSLDSTKLASAVASSAQDVSNLIAEKMAALSTLVSDMQSASSGTLALRRDALEANQKSLDDRATREQDRLTRYAEALRKQFTQMDSTVAANQALLTQLSKLSTG